MVRALLIRNGVVQMMDTTNIDMSAYSTDISDIQSRDGLRMSTVPIQMVLITYNKESELQYNITLNLENRDVYGTNVLCKYYNSLIYVFRLISTDPFVGFSGSQ